MKYNNIKTYDDACDALMVDSEPLRHIECPESLRRPLEAYGKVLIIIRALNEGWNPDWMDFKQEKHILNFEMNKEFNPVYVSLDKNSGDNWDDYPGSPVNSLMVFRSYEIMVFAAENFRSIFREYFMPSAI